MTEIHLGSSERSHYFTLSVCGSRKSSTSLSVHWSVSPTPPRDVPAMSRHQVDVLLLYLDNRDASIVTNPLTAPIRFVPLLLHQQDRYREFTAVCQEICLLYDVQTQWIQHLGGTMESQIVSRVVEILRTSPGDCGWQQDYDLCVQFFNFLFFRTLCTMSKVLSGSIRLEQTWSPRWTRSRTGKRKNIHMCGELTLYTVVFSGSAPHVEETPRNPSALTCLPLTLN